MGAETGGVGQQQGHRAVEEQGRQWRGPDFRCTGHVPPIVGAACDQARDQQEKGAKRGEVRELHSGQTRSEVVRD